MNAVLIVVLTILGTWAALFTLLCIMSKLAGEGWLGYWKWVAGK